MSLPSIMTTPFMPFHGEHSAPIFDHNQPSTLRQYLVQLDRLFARCVITSSLEKKEYATSFLKGDIAECWEALPEFIDPTKTYAQFTYRLLDLYNQITDCYTVHDLESLVSDRIPNSIQSLEEISISSHCTNSPSCTSELSTPGASPRLTSDCRSSTCITLHCFHTRSTRFSKPHDGYCRSQYFSLPHPFRLDSTRPQPKMQMESSGVQWSPTGVQSSPVHIAIRKSSLVQSGPLSY